MWLYEAFYQKKFHLFVYFGIPRFVYLLRNSVELRSSKNCKPVRGWGWVFVDIYIWIHERISVAENLICIHLLWNPFCSIFVYVHGYCTAWKVFGNYWIQGFLSVAKYIWTRGGLYDCSLESWKVHCFFFNVSVVWFQEEFEIFWIIFSFSFFPVPIFLINKVAMSPNVGKDGIQNESFANSLQYPAVSSQSTSHSLTYDFFCSDEPVEGFCSLFLFELFSYRSCSLQLW